MSKIVKLTDENGDVLLPVSPDTFSGSNVLSLGEIDSWTADRDGEIQYFGVVDGNGQGWIDIRFLNRNNENACKVSSVVDHPWNRIMVSMKCRKGESFTFGRTTTISGRYVLVIYQ